MKGIDLFAGAGGFSIAMESNGIDVILSNDISEYSQKICQNNFDHKFIKCPIESIKILPKCDIITAGFPCQPFSIAGQKKGMKDERVSGMKWMLKLIKKRPPKMLLFENVKNFLTMNDGDVFNWFSNKIVNMGYDFHYQVINSSDYLPQNRERLFMVCFDTPTDFVFPESTNNNDWRTYLDTHVNPKYYYYKKSKLYPLLKTIDNDHFYQYRRTYLRENKSGVCPTLTANMGSGGHNVPIILDNHPRKLTPRECFRFQGYPDDYDLSGLSDTRIYHLAGNSVTIPVVQSVIHQMLLTSA